MTSTIADARDNGGGMVQSLVKRTADIPGDWEKQASKIVAGEIVPALERQLAELQRQRGLATGDPGMRERPHGAGFYAWALRASTTTRVPAEDLHQLGQDQPAERHGRLDPTLKRSEERRGGKEWVSTCKTPW